MSQLVNDHRQGDTYYDRKNKHGSLAVVWQIDYEWKPEKKLGPASPSRGVAGVGPINLPSSAVPFNAQLR
jgi:hypothetical protein